MKEIGFANRKGKKAKKNFEFVYKIPKADFFWFAFYFRKNLLIGKHKKIQLKIIFIYEKNKCIKITAPYIVEFIPNIITY